MAQASGFVSKNKCDMQLKIPHSIKYFIKKYKLILALALIRKMPSFCNEIICDVKLVFIKYIGGIWY